ncbi:hypothetical protein HDU96_007970 [Phlyctochytrium bullatum]|nr:hypothetical protein HDU96_007970 [Phlyctochytrium bullatum]
MTSNEKGTESYSDETKKHAQLPTTAVVVMDESELLAVASELERMERKRVQRVRMHRFLSAVVIFGIIYHSAHLLGFSLRNACSKHKMLMVGFAFVHPHADTPAFPHEKKTTDDEPAYKYPETPDLIPSKEFEPAIKCTPNEAQYPVYPENGSFDLPPVAEDLFDIFNGAMMVLNFTVNGVANSHVTFIPQPDTDDNDATVPSPVVAHADIHFHFADKDLIQNVTLTTGWDAPGVYGIHIVAPSLQPPNSGDEGFNALDTPKVFGHPRFLPVPSAASLASKHVTTALPRNPLAALDPAEPTPPPCINAAVRIAVPKDAFRNLKLLIAAVDLGVVSIDLEGDRVANNLAVAVGLGAATLRNVEVASEDEVFPGGQLFLLTGLGNADVEDVSATGNVNITAGWGSLTASNLIAGENVNVTAGLANLNISNLETEGGLYLLSNIGQHIVNNITFSTSVISNLTNSGNIELTHLTPRSASTFESVQAQTQYGAVTLDEVHMPAADAEDDDNDEETPAPGVVSAIAAMGSVKARVLDFHGALTVIGLPARVKGTELDLTTNTQRKVQGTRGLVDGERPRYRFVGVSGAGAAEAVFE